MRTNFKMTQEDYDKLIEVCKPIPLIAMHCSSPGPPQASANEAWCALGKKMGFDGMTAKPGSSKLEFTAEIDLKDRICIVFDGPPGPEPGRFVEVEKNGKGVNAGTWVQDGDLWMLVLNNNLLKETP